MNELQIFENSEFGEVRTVVVNDEPMFCLSDVCRALGIVNVGNVKNRLSNKGICSMDTLTNGGTQTLLYINESNLYKTIFQSRKESAERFTEWVTSEVLRQEYGELQEDYKDLQREYDQLECEVGDIEEIQEELEECEEERDALQEKYDTITRRIKSLVNQYYQHYIELEDIILELERVM